MRDRPAPLTPGVEEVLEGSVLAVVDELVGTGGVWRVPCCCGACPMLAAACRMWSLWRRRGTRRWMRWRGRLGCRGLRCVSGSTGLVVRWGCRGGSGVVS
jgi:hypothetical protein